MDGGLVGVCHRERIWTQQPDFLANISQYKCWNALETKAVETKTRSHAPWKRRSGETTQTHVPVQRSWCDPWFMVNIGSFSFTSIQRTKAVKVSSSNDDTWKTQPSRVIYSRQQLYRCSSRRQRTLCRLLVNFDECWIGVLLLLLLLLLFSFTPD